MLSVDSFGYDGSKTSHFQEQYDDPSRYGRTVDLDSSPIMSAEKLVQICVKNGGYAAPELNDQLWLHQCGFTCISKEVLEPYCNCRTLFFQTNGLTKIQNLEVMPDLQVLYLQGNCIPRIENLLNLQKLMVLNLGSNQITEVPPNSLPHSLEQLNLSKNLISTLDGLKGVMECPKLSNVDMSSNLIEETDAFLEVWTHLALECLYLRHNPGINKLKMYRKKAISSIPTLRCLDDKPIKDLERVGAVAWSKGENEEAAKKTLFDKEKDEKLQSFLTFRKIQQITGRNISARMEAEKEEREEKQERKRIRREKKQALRAAAEEARPKEMEEMMKTTADITDESSTQKREDKPAEISFVPPPRASCELYELD